MAINKATGLTDKQEKFCQEYLIDCNATQAAIRAGYSEKTSYSIGEENLRKPEIQKRLSEIRKPLEEKTGITQEWVLKRFKEISDRCMTAIPVMVYDPESKSMVQKLDDEGNGVWEFDSSGANKSTEMIGRHLGFFEKDKDKAPAVQINANMTKEEIATIAKGLEDKF